MICQTMVRQIHGEVHFLVGLFAWFDVADNFILKNFLDCFFYLLEKDLWNPTTQGVDSV